MTKEEIIRIFEKMQDTFLKDTEFRNAIDSAIEILSQPSLPSGLDEAAEKILSETFPQLHNGSFLTEREMVKLIKAGAEWMSGQGETIFDTVVIDGRGERWLTDNLLQGDYDCGEEVIVQIRKK